MPLERGKLRLEGGDRVRFLEGMVSNEVSSLGPGETCYATVLNRKGRILSDLVVLALEDALLLDTAAGRAATVAEALDRHLIADDVKIEDLSTRWGHIAIEGPGAAELLSERELPCPAPGRFVVVSRGDSLIAVGGGSLTCEGVQWLGPSGPIAELAKELSPRPLSADHVEVLRIEAFLPRYGADMTERCFPSEARLEERAVSHTKGCYIGQEIVARIHSRGAVNRFLCKIRTEAPVSPGDEIRVGSTPVGTITSAASSAATGPVALGYVRKAESEPGTALDVGGIPGFVS